MLEKITPLILTFDEAPNIDRTLARLTWAKDIVVVDSFSTDATIDIVRRFPQARVFQRAFDCHANQWNFALLETSVSSEWILALDADYVLSQPLIDEIARLDPSTPIAAYRAAFQFCVFGRPVRGALYPPVSVLFRRERGRFFQDGHTHRLKADGAVAGLKNPILHDDRKTLAAWLAAQDRYMRLEAEKISSTQWAELKWPDRLRRVPPLAALAVFLHSYFIRGGLLDGKAGLYYALQRMLAECILGLRLLKQKL